MAWSCLFAQTWGFTSPRKDWGELGQNRQLCALLGLSTLLLSFFGSADLCTQGCQVCALVFLHRFPSQVSFTLSFFIFSLFLTSRHTEHAFLTLSGGGDLQESC